MKILIDECLHTSLVKVAVDAGHDAQHVTWLGLSGEADWDLMPRIVAGDWTFVTNNARDFRRLYAKQIVHAGLIIIVPQVAPARQRAMLERFLADLEPGEQFVNEVIELEIDGNELIARRYELSAN